MRILFDPAREALLVTQSNGFSIPRAFWDQQAPAWDPATASAHKQTYATKRIAPPELVAWLISERRKTFGLMQGDRLRTSCQIYCATTANKESVSLFTCSGDDEDDVISLNHESEVMIELKRSLAAMGGQLVPAAQVLAMMQDISDRVTRELRLKVPLVVQDQTNSCREPEYMIFLPAGTFMQAPSDVERDIMAALLAHDCVSSENHNNRLKIQLDGWDSACGEYVAFIRRAA